MISTMAPEKQYTIEQLSHIAEKTLPAAPFPRKYVHSVFYDRQDAIEAAQALLVADYSAYDISILTGSEYMEAVGRRQSLLGSFTSDDLDTCIDEARRGYTMLVVRPSNYGQMEQIRDLLAPRGAHHVKYIGTWTVAQLLP